MSTEKPRLSRQSAANYLVGGITALILGIFAYLAIDTRGLGRYDVEGRVLWSTDEDGLPTLGPKGWYVDASGDSVVLRNAISGQKHPQPTFNKPDRILPDGRYLDTLGNPRLRTPTGRDVAEFTANGASAGVAEVEDLRGIDHVQVLSASKRTLVVGACFAPKGRTHARWTGDAGSRSRVVVAGFRLTDGQRTWAKAINGPCEGSERVAGAPETLGWQKVLPVRDRTDRVQILDLDTGRPLAAWAGHPFGSLLVQGTTALRRSGSTATVTDLTTGKDLARTRCRQMRVMNPGGFSDTLAPEATLAVTCTDSVRLYDAKRQGFVTIKSPPVTKSQQIPDGKSVVHDRYLLSRQGSEITITDGISKKRTGTFSAPSNFRIATNAPRGRVLEMFHISDNDDSHTSFRIVDLPTGTVLVANADKLSPGAEVAPDGFAMIGATSERIGRGRRSAESSPATFLVGIKGTPED